MTDRTIGEAVLQRGGPTCDPATGGAGGVGLRHAADADAADVIGIFNHYAATGFAAYTEAPMPVGFYAALRTGTYAFRVLEDAGTVVGFGSVRPLLPFPAFDSAALLSYFIAPAYTGRGLGTRLLGQLAADARADGCATLVANVSSRNTASLAFHAARGFAEVGRLRAVGVKFDEPFDLVWLQRDL
jgi:L-amino acid N-acyltransferase